MKGELESGLVSDECKKLRGSNCHNNKVGGLIVYSRNRNGKARNAAINYYGRDKIAEGSLRKVGGNAGKDGWDSEGLRVLDEGGMVDVFVQDGAVSRLSEVLSEEEVRGGRVLERMLGVEVEVAREVVGNRTGCDVAGNGVGKDVLVDDDGVLVGLRKKLELKMSKKIVLDRKPTTVRQLFETGLLEDVPVIYMGGSKATCLRGTIKDDGILCRCSMCRGRDVISISKFEVHARKKYKRAAQYIFFENGKSLHDVLKACRDAPLHMLEATIQSCISSQNLDLFTCRRCQGSFAASFIKTDKKICCFCIEAKDRQPNSITASTQVVRSSVPDVMSKSSGPVSDVALRYARHQKTTIKSGQPVSKREPLRNASPSTHSTNKDQWRITTKDQRLHKLVFEEGGLLDGTELAYFARGKKLIEGYKKGHGIFCLHCNSQVSPSQFESHAGWASRKKPYSYIYTSNGVSLHEFAVSLSKRRNYSAKDNDNLCIICADGGDLVLCDGCPRAFHKECASLRSVPTGDWYCKYCQSMYQREKYVEHNANALAAGRVSGPDAIEQINKQCIRIVKNVEPEFNACALCRGYDFSKSGFGPRTIIICDQCDKEFHVGCLRDRNIKLKEIPKGEWFCCIDCKRINSTLKKLLVREAEKVPDPLLTVVQKKLDGKGDAVSNYDVRWKVLKGRMVTPETRILLSQVVNIFHECFGSIVDPVNGRDLIPPMVYGRSARGQEFCDMYCALLLVNSTVVSAAIFRVFGRELAELPLVATRKVDHGKGYFQLLFSCIEKLLSFLNVTCVVLPAAEEAESIWIEKFGFEKLNLRQVSILRRNCWQMVTFKDTCMLRKMICWSKGCK